MNCVVDWGDIIMFVDVKYLFDVVSIDLLEVSCYRFELFLIKMEE